MPINGDVPLPKGPRSAAVTAVLQVLQTCPEWRGTFRAKGAVRRLHTGQDGDAKPFDSGQLPYFECWGAGSRTPPSRVIDTCGTRELDLEIEYQVGLRTLDHRALADLDALIERAFEPDDDERAARVAAILDASPIVPGSVTVAPAAVVEQGADYLLAEGRIALTLQY